MSAKQIVSLIKRRDVKLAVLLCHHNADPDAICAAFTFSRLLKTIQQNIQVEIASAHGISRLSKLLLDYLPIKLQKQPRIGDANLIVLLDTNTIQQLDEWAEKVKSSEAPVIVVDHHASHPETRRLATLCLADEGSSSTCEIVYRLYKELKVSLTRMEATALFLGIAFDTRHFTLAQSETFKVIADLVNKGVNTREALSKFTLPMENSERIARLKACNRISLFKIGGWLIVTSYVGAYQASVARALVGLGAHVAAVGNQRGASSRISMRASQDFYEKTGIHLGRDIAQPLGEILRGMGGGHTTSAGVNGNVDVHTGIQHFIHLVKKKL